MVDSDYEALPHGRIKVPLPDGQHAELRTVPTMLGEDKQLILKAADADGVDLTAGIGLGAVDSLQRASLAQMTHSWTLTGPDGGPLPITAASLTSLPLDTYDELGAAVMPVVQRLLRMGEAALAPKSGAASSSLPAGGS